MSGAGAPAQKVVDCHDLRVAIVAASWHQTVMDGLVAGALEACRDYQVEAPQVVRVPGTFELPVVADALAAQGYDAVVALGVVIRGGTPHFEYVCSAATDGLSRVALDRQTAGRVRCADLRHRGAGAGPGRSRALARGQGLRGGVRGTDHGADPAFAQAWLRLGFRRVKTFDELWTELSDKAVSRPAGSGTVQQLDAGVHAIGKKLVEEAAESWMAAEHESKERAAEEISQLLYHAQVLMLACDLTLDDVYTHL